MLLGLLGGAFYTHYALGDPFERMAPSLIFALLVICRMVILYQVNLRERKEEELIRRLLNEVRSKEDTVRTTDDESDLTSSVTEEVKESKKIN
jgi:hypothetical protein